MGKNDYNDVNFGTDEGKHGVGTILGNGNKENHNKNEHFGEPEGNKPSFDGKENHGHGDEGKNHYEQNQKPERPQYKPEKPEYKPEKPEHKPEHNEEHCEEEWVCCDIGEVEEENCHCDPVKSGLTAVVNSIAHQENGLANILDNESKKICRAIGMAKCVDELIKIDESVQNTIKQINNVQIVLIDKLQEVSKICDGCEDDCRC